MKPHLGLRCIGVSHAFGETQVLSDVNLVTIPGETLAIIVVRQLPPRESLSR